MVRKQTGPVRRSTDSKRRQTPNKAIAIDHSRNTWTPTMAAAWAGIPARTLYRLLRSGIVPSITIGESQSQEWPDSRTGTRERACFRYMIPRTAFIKWFENIGSAPAGTEYAGGKTPQTARR